MRAIIAAILKGRRWTMLGWSVGASLYMILVTSVYTHYLASSSSGLSQTISQLPENLKSFISIKSDFTTPIGFLSSEPYYVILPIVLIILAIVLGSSLLAREEQDHTLELLLARPISRGRVLAGKALGGALVLAIVNLVILLVMIASSKIFDINIAVTALFKLHVMLFLLTLIFGALAFMFSAVGRNARKISAGVSALLAISGYILASLEGTVDWLRWPAKLLPYHYYKPNDVLSGSFNWVTFFSFLAVIVVLVIVAWLGFRRRDIE